jgi:hypothetical protein
MCRQKYQYRLPDGFRQGNSVLLKKRKIYVALPDTAASKHGLLRIVDESGEDYLYPKSSARFDTFMPPGFVRSRSCRRR